MNISPLNLKFKEEKGKRHHHTFPAVPFQYGVDGGGIWMLGEIAPQVKSSSGESSSMGGIINHLLTFLLTRPSRFCRGSYRQRPPRLVYRRYTCVWAWAGARSMLSWTLSQPCSLPPTRLPCFFSPLLCEGVRQLCTWLDAGLG